MSVALRGTTIFILALLGGLGTAYVPSLTFTVVAIMFALGLWTFVRSRGLSFVGFRSFWRPETTEGKSQFRGTLVTKLVSAYLFFWWLALVAPVASFSPRGLGNAVQSSQGGNPTNQVLILSFGLVGALFLPTAMNRLRPVFLWVLVPWLVYLGWAATSLYWSVYPPLTFRNVGAFVLITVGCFGLGAGFYGARSGGRNLFLRHLFVAAVISALAVIIPLPFNWSQYDLLNPSVRLAIGGQFTTFVSRPVMITVLVLAATWVMGMREWRRRDWLWLLFFIIPVVALKARGPVLWALLAIGLFYILYKARVHDRVWQIVMVLVATLGGYIYYINGTLDWIIPYLTRGDVEYTESLSNRIPIWNVLLPDLQEHLWKGAGFAAFWSPENYARIQQLTGISVVSAHNGYLEELLNTGIVGLSILTVFILCSLVVALREARNGDPFGWLTFIFLAYFLLLNITNSLLQNFLQLPFLIILTSLAMILSKPAAEQTARQEPRGSPRRYAAAPHQNVPVGPTGTRSS